MLCYAPTARAEWHETSSTHFVVYANHFPGNIRRFAEKLERYHAALATVFTANSAPPSPSNRVTVFVARDVSEVQKLRGPGASAFVQGFYRGAAGDSIAVVPRIDSAKGREITPSEQTLLHEYAHHFLQTNTEMLIPTWYSEGMAEFYATAEFRRDGSVGLGLPAQHRAYELRHHRDVPLKHIFSASSYATRRYSGYDNFYGRSWLLYHYLFFSKTRAGQSDDYLNRIQLGIRGIDAAVSSFGPLATLETELINYRDSRRLAYVRVPAAKLNPAPVKLRKLRQGEAAILPILIRSKLNGNLADRSELVTNARQIAKLNDNDPVVLAALAELEVAAGNYSEGIAAAEAAINRDPRNVRAHLQKGDALAEIADHQVDESARARAWSVARKEYMKANRLETENPLPLVRFYESYIRQGTTPTENAVLGLEWALSLAPFDANVRMQVAERQMIEKRYSHARDSIAPLAFHPHERQTGRAATLLAEARHKLLEQRADQDIKAH